MNCAYLMPQFNAATLNMCFFVAFPLTWGLRSESCKRQRDPTGSQRIMACTATAALAGVPCLCRLEQGDLR